MEWVTTSTLLRDLCDYENRTAWERFVERFRGPIAAFARRAGLNHSDAEDVAQESLTAFAEAYRAGKFDPTKGRLSAWLFGISHRQILRQRQQLARRAARDGAQPDTSFWAEHPGEDDGMQRLWDESLWEACAALVAAEFEPTSYRAFELVVRDGLTSEEAAAKLGVSVNSVYNAKHRVLKQIRQRRDDLDALD
jgi:RNA polymerase sigma-70 factor (ECF subfamily)